MRAGLIETPHGACATPAFMPVATQGTVKGLLPSQLREAGIEIVLANAFHLSLRPGVERISSLGGLHKFMGWDGPILTDSGGYQVFSLAGDAGPAPSTPTPSAPSDEPLVVRPSERAGREDPLRKRPHGRTANAGVQVTEEGVQFRSPVDGASVEFTPARVIAIQRSLGVDLLMPLDQPVAWPCAPEATRDAMERTLRWAALARKEPLAEGQALFGIVQGGFDPGLRRESAARTAALDFAGYAIGGLCLGEPRETRRAALAAAIAALPEDRPRYAMGVGHPADILDAIALGVDLFDCVLPTRNGRNGWAFTDGGIVRIRNASHAGDSAPLEPGCPCPACSRFSRAYLRHLFHAEEMLGPSLVSIHNCTWYARFFAATRDAIRAGSFEAFREGRMRVWGSS
ncbi:MAG: tRNA guanosine(34) transglycosylase Tgt [Planctomycetes bacterium]|nr:tRNA guanosine(34) transglycosylase Tgt [Planctomycetota bacterium]